MRWEGLESIPYQNRVATLFNHQILLFVQTMQTDYTYRLNDESCVFLLLSFYLNYVLHNTYHFIWRLFRFYKLNKTDYLNQSLISIEQIQFDEDNPHKIIKMCLLHTPWYPFPPKRTLASNYYKSVLTTQVSSSELTFLLDNIFHTPMGYLCCKFYVNSLRQFLDKSLTKANTLFCTKNYVCELSYWTPFLWFMLAHLPKIGWHFFYAAISLICAYWPVMNSFRPTCTKYGYGTKQALLCCLLLSLTVNAHIVLQWHCGPYFGYCRFIYQVYCNWFVKYVDLRLKS